MTTKDVLALALDALEQMIACHDEPTCPSIVTAREAITAIKQAQEPVSIAMVLVDREVLVRAKTALREALESIKALEKTGGCGIDDWAAGTLVKRSLDEVSAALAAPKQSQEPKNVWQRAIDDELVSLHLGIANNDATYAQAKLKLHELICWSIQVDKDLSAPKQAEPAWQPIESAPKDGTMVLCWVSAVQYGETDEGQPFQRDISQIDFGSWEDGIDGNGYFYPYCGQIGDQQHVTHWMPLPTPPEAT